MVSVGAGHPSTNLSSLMPNCREPGLSAICWLLVGSLIEPVLQMIGKFAALPNFS